MEREEKLLNNIAKLVEVATGVTLQEMREVPKGSKKNLARGVFLVVASVYEIHPKVVARFLNRSRASIIITTKRYLDYISVGDKELCEYTQAILNLLKTIK